MDRDVVVLESSRLSFDFETQACSCINNMFSIVSNYFLEHVFYDLDF